MSHKIYDHTPFSHILQNVNTIHDNQLSFGQRVSDVIANKMGSWNFIIIQAIIMSCWILLNVIVFIYHWDVYPFVLLNLAMSAQAAFATPLIMMSQNRQTQKDRFVANNDYKINQKSEHELRQIMEHLSAQDDVLTALTEKLERHEKILAETLRRVAAANGSVRKAK